MSESQQGSVRGWLTLPHSVGIEPHPAPSGLLALKDMDLRDGHEDGLDERRKKLRYRAWHRGTREMDLVLGPFADAQLAAMSAAELDAFEALMEAADPDLFGWVVGQAPIPAAVDGALFRRLVAFHQADKGTARP
jgi:antitoxin CptB